MLDYEDLCMRYAVVLAAIFLTACGSPVDPVSELSARPSKQELYPLSPDDSLTPGATCKNPTEYRYPEHIPYCARSVSSSLKHSIIKKYDRTFKYSIGSMPRNHFKIDHYIPLCMGGSNEPTNLWPQHKTVYIHTDSMEQKLCLHLERGHITQAVAISYIKQIKHHLNEIDRIDQQIEDEYGSL